MATPANLSDVTQALAALLQHNVERIANGAIGPFTVSRLPPEKAEEAADTRLNIHLYHVAQDHDGGVDLPTGRVEPQSDNHPAHAAEAVYVLPPTHDP